MKNNNYYDGLNMKLLRSIPSNSGKILELGCANGKLGEVYKIENVNSHWVGVDISPEAVQISKLKLDKAILININNENISDIFKGEKYDVIVIGDLLEHLINPNKLLEELHLITTEEARIICCIPNMTHYSVIQKMLTGDISYEDMGLLDKTHLKFYSQSSAFKIFLDSGWLPNLVDQCRIEPSNDQFIQGLLHSAFSEGIPNKTSLRNLGMYQMIINAEKRVLSDLINSPNFNISVVVPVNRDWEFKNNILSSPGLKEINAEIIPVKNAKSSAEAFHAGKRLSKNPWILYLHQDVYVPKGSGKSLLQRISQGLDENVPIGFAGLQLSNTSLISEAGLVIDRTTLFKHKITSSAISADEFAILMHQKCIPIIDDTLGWHLWATDLFLQAFLNKNIGNGLLLDIPLFHNSLNDFSLPKEFHESTKKLLNKYPDLEKIETLCGTLSQH